jgi:hypothetical protein
MGMQRRIAGRDGYIVCRNDQPMAKPSAARTSAGMIFSRSIGIVWILADPLNAKVLPLFLKIADAP